jgi:hypothetical protein
MSINIFSPRNEYVKWRLTQVHTTSLCKQDHNIGFQEKRQLFRLIHIGKNCQKSDQNIDHKPPHLSVIQYVKATTLT